MAEPVSGPFDVVGRRALVSGGTSGIGYAIAAALIAGGASVAVMGRRTTEGREAAERLGATFVCGDVVSRENCDAAVAAATSAFGGLDTVVAAAGINRRKPPEAVTEADWDAVVDVNLKGTFHLCNAAFEQLKASGDGRIVTIGSMMSILANGMTTPYAAAKGGVVQLTRSYAVGWAAHGVKANCILPGWIDTPLTVQARADMPGLNETVLARTPAGRWGLPEDIAGVAAFLCSPAAAFVTGAALPVDGGYSIRG